MSWAAVASIGGAVVGGLMDGGDKETTAKTEPWKPAQPYLTGALQENENLYNTLGPIAPYTGNQLAFLPQNMANSVQGTIDATQNSIPDVMSMVYGSLAGPLGYNDQSSQMVQGSVPGQTSVAGPANLWANSLRTVPQMDAAQIQGSGIDFATALNQALYGDPGSNPWITGMAGNMVDQTQQQFGDVSRGMQDQLQQALMGLRDISGQSGTLGGSRQALLSGEAMGRTNDALAREYGDMNTNLQGSLSNLYGGIFENDLNRKASLASQLFGADATERMRQAELSQDASKTNMGAIIADRAAQTAAQSNGNSAINQWMAEQQLKMDQQRLAMDAGQLAAGYSSLPLSLQNAAVGTYNTALRPDEQNAYNLAASQYYESANAPYDAFLRYLNPITTIGGMGSAGKVTRPGDTLAGAMSGFNLGSDIAGLFK